MVHVTSHQSEGPLASRATVSTVGIKCIQLPDVFPLTPIVNKSCKIEYCFNKILQIFQDTVFSQSLELELSMFRRTTISGQHPLV